MSSKIEDRHRQKSAYVYLRQSTMGQVRLNPESTERQYALRDKAFELGWSPGSIRVLDRDLGVSGTQSANREDFKALMAEVSLGTVGAIFALEASRLARSSLDWHRLIKICSLTGTLVIDEDGCYDPSDFNDGLLLGLKGTLAEAELHFLRARLHGAKLNKAKKGELRIRLPVGLCHDGGVVLDPNQEVQGSIRRVFSIFREMGSAYGVVHRFVREGLLFPKRIFGGAGHGKLSWGGLTHSRVLDIVKNPGYAGVYVFGRSHRVTKITSEGQIDYHTRVVPMDAWLVMIKDHHEGYISWDEFVDNLEILRKNRPPKGTLLNGSAREGSALLQGLLLCGKCGWRLGVRYQGTGGRYGVYECSRRAREGFSKTYCMHLRCDQVDPAVSKRVLEILTPSQVEIAWKALRELEQREDGLCRQWQMRIERAEYEAQLSQRRYEEVDPSNRLVAATLERSWNDALLELEKVKQEYARFRRKEAQVATPEQKVKVLALAQDLPRLWNAPTTKAKDRKRILRLLIKDITVEKNVHCEHAVLHIRWQGGALEDLQVELPRYKPRPTPYPKKTVQRIRDLAETHSDSQIAEILNAEGHLSVRGKPLIASRVESIRHANGIDRSGFKHPEELTVREIVETFGVPDHVVRHWLDIGLINGRKVSQGTASWITIDSKTEGELLERARRWASARQLAIHKRDSEASP